MAGKKIPSNKGSTSRPLPAVGSNPIMSAMMGGISNRPTNPSAKKGGKAFNKGGRAK
jgi:hypothetical protein